MPAKPSAATPRYRRQKARPRDRAFVELGGRRCYLGPWGTPESRRRYDQVIAEWLGNSRQRPVNAADLTVVELCARYWAHAEAYYRRPDGTPTSTLDKCRLVIKRLRELYGPTPAANFGPVALRAVRQQMIDARWSRAVINQMIGWTRRVFRWGVAQELIPAQTYTALTTVEPLRRGRSSARETDPVGPVPDAHIEAIRPFVNPHVWAMIQLQMMTGARPGEIVRLRAADIDTSGDVWSVRPGQHKTAHHGHRRQILFGPKAQEVLRPFMLSRPLDKPLFSPAEAEAARRAARHTRRKTPLNQGNRPGTHRVAQPARKPSDSYTTASYEQAVTRGCDRAFPPPTHLARLRVKGRRGLRWESRAQWRTRLGPEGWASLQTHLKGHRWHPNQLRHSFATRLRGEFGIDVAQTLLGHRMGSAVTEIYAEANIDRATQAIRKVG